MLRMRRFLHRLKRDFKASCLENVAPDIAAMDKQISEFISTQNRAIWEENDPAPDRPIGFCMAMAMVCNRMVRCKWLGDCRIYHIRPPRDAGGRIVVKLLSHDQNMLCRNIEENESYTFLKNEMTELSRTLLLYWGKPEQLIVQQTLSEQSQETELAPRDLLLLLTDGLFLPLIRAKLDLSNYNLTKDEFTLEEWLSSFLERGAFFDPSRADRWQEVVPALMETTEQYTGRKTRYRDDMAAVVMRLETAAT